MQEHPPAQSQNTTTAATPAVVPNLSSAHTTTEVSPPIPTTTKTSAWYLVFEMLIYATVAVVAALLAVKFFPTLFEQQKPVTQNFVVVDMEELAREQVLAMGDMVRNGAISAEEMPIKTRAFSQALMEQLAIYATKNIVVLNSSAVAALPESVSDETNAVRSELQKSGVMARRMAAEK